MPVPRCCTLLRYPNVYYLLIFNSFFGVFPYSKDKPQFILLRNLINISKRHTVTVRMIFRSAILLQAPKEPAQAGSFFMFFFFFLFFLTEIPIQTTGGLASPVGVKFIRKRFTSEKQLF